MTHRMLAAALVLAAAACGGRAPVSERTPVRTSSAISADASPAVAREPHAGEERFLRNIRQLTFGGENAEAYFSSDGSQLIFQSSRDGRACDQQYTMRVDGSNVRRVSNGLGKTTCGYFYDSDRRVLFSSTHHVMQECPPRPDMSRGYVWPLDPYEIYTARADGSDLRRLTNWNTYTAEATVSPDGRTIVFTTLKGGDLDIYTMNVDGTNVRRLTTRPGYAGGAFFSPDGSQIVYRAHHPTDSAELASYRALLRENKVRPSRMEIWVMNADGSGQRQVTNLGGANFAPFFTPDGRRIIFSSNHTNPRGRTFNLYMVNLDGTGLQQVTFEDDFDGFPQFSPDGRHLVWASNRHGSVEGETNVFMAEWVGN
jgi:TolB protein